MLGWIPRQEGTFIIEGASVLPYLSCPSCRLTVFIVAGHSHANEECPRCGTTLDEKPRRLFEHGPGVRGPPKKNVRKNRPT
jgi:uncharacterized paraquat-inducible protein A